MKTFARIFLAAGIFITVGVLSGCAGVAPNYAPSIDHVEVLKKSGAAAAKVGAMVPQPGMQGAETLGLRSLTMASPVGKNYGDYLAAALRSELELANLYDAASPTEVSGTLLKNNVNAGGINTNDGQIEARFIVKRGAEVRFDKVKKGESQWESAFAGATAIPLAANNYVLLVQQLVGNLIADPDFIQAMKQ